MYIIQYIYLTHRLLYTKAEVYWIKTTEDETNETTETLKVNKNKSERK